METARESGERILVCLSPSPTNQKVIGAAIRMAEAFHAALTAIYIRPSHYDSLPEEDKERLQRNIRFAEQGGASVTTIVGDDIPVQIAEFAHISGTTKIVMGRSGAKRQHFWSKPPLTEQIILNAPDVDVYIIPDSSVDLKYQHERRRRTDRTGLSVKDSLLTFLLLVAVTLVGLAFMRFGFSEANIITVFILGVLLISVVTVSPLYSVVSSLASVLLFNYFFIEPRFSFHTYETEYAVTFAIMLASALITGTLANKLKASARQAAHEAFRARVLFDTNQLLQKAGDADSVIRITAGQVITLLDREVTVYRPDSSGQLGAGSLFDTGQTAGRPLAEDPERETAEWAFAHREPAGCGTERYPEAQAVYHPVSLNRTCYGVIGIRLNGRPLETFEYSVYLSILGECALALESLRNAEEKEQAARIARNEQLRSNLLRTISHDIRTPLTSISGNASNLLNHYEQLDREALEQIFSDIYDDSEWLIDLVENLLSISRIENVTMDLHLAPEVVGDVIDEALKHVDRRASTHRITVESGDRLLLARMDTRLITQVLINLINNAVKNTQPDSAITVRSEKRGAEIAVSVCDDGPGIPDGIKPHVFEMFYTGENKIADGRRGLGLGLALCRAIVEAHGGMITLSDNPPHGCCFCFTLPAQEVPADE